MDAPEIKVSAPADAPAVEAAGSFEVVLHKPEIWTSLGIELDNPTVFYTAIVSLAPGSIAAQSRLRPGLCVLSVNGRTVDGHEMCAGLLQASKGDVRLVVQAPPDRSIATSPALWQGDSRCDRRMRAYYVSLAHDGPLSPPPSPPTTLQRLPHVLAVATHLRHHHYLSRRAICLLSRLGSCSSYARVCAGVLCRRFDMVSPNISAVSEHTRYEISTTSLTAPQNNRY